MNAVTLKKDGAINLNGKTVRSDALELLSFQIALEKGYTLRSFFEMLDKYTLFAKLNAFFPTYTPSSTIAARNRAAMPIYSIILNSAKRSR